MSINRINEAVAHQPLRDLLRGLVTYNPTSKGCVSAQNSLIDPALSTAGSVVVNGKFSATIAASSSFFALTDTIVPIGGACTFVLCANAAGSGIGYPATVLTSAQVSAAGATAATAQAAADLQTVSIPDTMCPVGLYTVVAGSAAIVAGSTTFSVTTSAGGSHLFTDIAQLQSISANP